ncbi:MAG TPA: alpha-amylase family protein [Arsenicitalea sp.]|jgi:beta-galactosidase|nr:alpha-amylase family protein [Arsenicitalea sp.]
MTYPDMPTVPYGAVYFRKTNPPKADWERDYATASEDGHNIFRHWFMWSSIETRPGVFDWDDFDRQLDLAHKYKIKTIIAEMITAAPEWLYHQRPEGRYRRADGRPYGPQMGGSSATGGWPGMSLDDEVVKERAGQFLTALVNRYKDHPSLGGYDVWNECGYHEDEGYSPATLNEFRRWLEKRYGDLAAVGKAWGRFSLAEWDQVTPPEKIESYADSMDWLEFLQDNAHRHMRWRVDLIRKLDPKHLITAHGVAATLVSGATRGTDDWRAAAEVDLYGLTWVASRQGDKPYQHIHAVDLVRAASRGKPFWHAEAQAGPLWLQPQVIGRPLYDGRVTKAEDVRIWNLTSFAAGASGLLYPRWRPLLDGPLFGAFGAYGMDGSRTDRSEMTAKVAKWANDPAQAKLWQSSPVKGEIGLVYIPETQIQDLALQGKMDTYTRAMRGAYQGFFENNIQADFVHIDDIDQYDVLYLAYPIMMKEAAAKRLDAWVRKGGKLISEGLPAYFGAHGHAGPTQPNFGFDALFGATQTDVVFAPDLFDDLKLTVLGHAIEGGAFLQRYAARDGKPAGQYADGTLAAVENAPGAGKTLLIGSFPSLGFFRHHSEGSRKFFRSLLDWAGARPRVTTSNAKLTARLHEGTGGKWLWVLNPSREAQDAVIALPEDLQAFNVHWGASTAARIEAGKLAVRVEARDAVILAIT